MPSGPQHLRDKFMTDDSDGIERCETILEKNFTIHRGMVRPITASYTPNEEEGEAIDYLVLEWDYGYETMELGADSSVVECITTARGINRILPS